LFNRRAEALRNMLKRFFNFKYAILALVIVVLLLSFILVLRRSQLVEDAAIVLVQVAQTQAALSSYLAERGVYPAGEDLLLGGPKARQLCLGTVPDETTAYLGDGSACSGVVLLDFRTLKLLAQLVYNSEGVNYRLEFNLPTNFGSFKTKGIYCATERGIVAGKCLHQ